MDDGGTIRAMTNLRLIVGNKNYSSWSLRGYLLAKQVGMPVDETVIPLYQGDFKAQIVAHAPSGLVPVLHHGDITVWDTFAMAEYLAETFPEAGLWPEDPARRAAARCVAAEMHSGFTAVRTHMPMDMRADRPGRGRGPGVDADIARICDIWRAAEGPFLFGAFGAADAFYAPVVSRFRTYGVELDDACRAYGDAVWSHPPMAAWLEAARAEPWTLDFEVA